MNNEPAEYTLYVQEVMGRQNIVYEEKFSELPPSFYSMDRRCLWIMDPETKRVRMRTFEWNGELQVTTRVIERTVILPPEIEVKKEIYKSEEVRKKLAENLLTKLFSEDYATPEHIDTLANAHISQVPNDYYRQIVVSLQDLIVVNTENHSVLYWDLKTIKEEDEQLKLSDAQSPPRLSRAQDGWSVSYLINWAPGDLCIIMQ